MTEWPKPSAEKLLDIVKAAYEGKVVVPEFQRSFIWSRRQVEELLVSIMSGYFIGNFLTLDWYGDKPPFPPRIIEGVKEVNPKVLSTKYTRIQYILDGQQRITAIFYALYAPPIPLKGGKTPCRFFIDIEKLLTRKPGESVPEDAIKGILTSAAQDLEQAQKAVDKGTYVSFTMIANQPAAVEWLYSKQTYLKTKENQRKLLDYINIVHDFPVPVIAIDQSIGIEAIVDTFERINRTGTRLSTFDLLVAVLYPEVKLRDLWSLFEEEAGTALSLRANEVADVVEAEYLAKVISLSLGKSCKKTDILTMGKDNFARGWEKAKKAIIEAFKRMKEEYGVVDLKRHVPYYAMTVPLAALLLKIEELGKGKSFYDKLDMWYWSAVLSERYESSADTYASGDYNDTAAWFIENKMPSWIGSVSDRLRGEDLESSDSRSAIYRGVMGLIKLNGAKDFHTGQKVPLSNYEDDHLFPSSKFKDHPKVNPILNRTLIDKDTNSLKIKGAKKPSEYLPLFAKELGGEEILKEILKTHLISEKGYSAMKNDNIDEFLKARQESILEAARTKIALRK